MSTHFPECINFAGPCCPWMGDCTCQCICDILGACEKRVIDKAFAAVLELTRKPGAHGEHYLSAINRLRGVS
jgi:hypothetical protein